MAGEWESAVKGILAGRPGEREELQDARRLFWEAGDPAGAAQQMPLRMGAERACLQVRNTEHPCVILGVPPCEPSTTATRTLARVALGVRDLGVASAAALTMHAAPMTTHEARCEIVAAGCRRWRSMGTRRG